MGGAISYLSTARHNARPSLVHAYIQYIHCLSQCNNTGYDERIKANKMPSKGIGAPRIPSPTPAFIMWQNAVWPLNLVTSLSGTSAHQSAAGDPCCTTVIGC